MGSVRADAIRVGSNPATGLVDALQVSRDSVCVEAYSCRVRVQADPETRYSGGVDGNSSRHLAAPIRVCRV